jgi:hypothetical protein
MTANFDDKRKAAYSGRRSIMDYGMGVIIAGFGLFFLASERLGIVFLVDPVVRYLFSGLCLIYGAFRIYRGTQKKYFRDE